MQFSKSVKAKKKKGKSLQDFSEQRIRQLFGYYYYLPYLWREIGIKLSASEPDEYFSLSDLKINNI